MMRREKARRDEHWKAQQEGNGRRHGRMVEADTSSETEQTLKGTSSGNRQAVSMNKGEGQ